MNIDALQALIDSAVLEPAAWRQVCDAVARYLGGVGTAIVPEAVEDQTPQIVASSSLDPLIAAAFRGDWQFRNYRQRALPLIKLRGYATDLDIADETVMAREPFYTDLLAPQGLGVYVGLHIPAGPETFIAAVQRSLKAPLPDAALFERVEQLQPILASGARASVAIGRMRIETWKELVTDTPRGFFVVDPQRRVLDRNATADAMLGRELAIANRHVVLAQPRANEQLQRLIALAAADTTGILPRPVFVDLPGQGSVMFDAVRLPPSLRYFHSHAAALVMMRPIGEVRTSLPALLRQRFGLTDAEVRVALALFDGRSAEEIAEGHGVAVGTVRQQIKAVLRKSGSRRQAEFLAQLRRLGDGDSG